MSRVFRYLCYMSPGIVLGVLLWLALLLPRRKRLEKNGLAGGTVRELNMLLFWMFTGGMAAITLAPEPSWLFDWICWARRGDLLAVFNAYGGFARRTFPLEHRINLIPFSQADGPFNIIGNVVMFLPFGFFAALLWRGWNGKRAALAGLGITAFIECWQILVGRYFDIDDIILNTLGVFCGYLLWLLFQKCAPEFTEKFHVNEET